MKNVKVTAEDLYKAYQLGATAFEKGMKCVPARDIDLEKFLYEHLEIKKVGDSIPYTNQWLKGWIDSNLRTAW